MRQAYYAFKEGTEPIIDITLWADEETGTMQGIAGATVTLRWKPKGGADVATLTKVLAIVDTLGVVRFTPTAAESIKGVYEADIEVEFADGTSERWPSRGFIIFDVTDAVG